MKKTTYHCPCGTKEFDMYIAPAQPLKKDCEIEDAVYVKVAHLNAAKRVKYCPACGAKTTINK